MAERAKADCGANLVERSYSLNGARFALVARGTALLRCHAKTFWTRLTWTTVAGTGYVYDTVELGRRHG
jgi:hypothetical protein